MLERLRRLLLGEDGFGRISVGAAMVIALGAGLGAYYLQRDTANAWVDSNGGTCVWSSTPATYADATACSSFQAAYAAAGTSSGGTVRVKDTGASPDYGTQSMTPSGTKTGAIVFRPAEGETVTLSDLNIGTLAAAGPNFVTVRGMELVNDRANVSFSDDIRFEQMTLPGLNTNGVTRFTFSDGEIDLCCDSGNYVQIDNCTAGAPTCLDARATVDFTIEDSYIHDNVVIDDITNSVHGQCLQTNGTGGAIDGVIIRRNIFQNCTDVTWLAYGETDDAVVENNFFDRPMPANEDQVDLYRTDICNPDCVRYGFSFDLVCSEGTCSNNVVNYNSALGEITIRQNGGTLGSGNSMTGNIYLWGSACAPGGGGGTVTHRYNMRNTGADSCGTGDFTVSTTNITCGGVSIPSFTGQWIDGDPCNGAMDFHLSGGANAAVGAGDTGSFPSDDIDASARSSPPDVGADER